MPVVFADLLEPKLNIPGTPGGGTFWQDLVHLVAEYDAVPPNWVFRLGANQIARHLQLDKYEPVVTYYLFAALQLATNNFARADLIRDLLVRAFRSPTVVEEVVLHCGVCGWENLHFEALIPPTKPIRQAVDDEIYSEPVGYIREIGGAGHTAFEGDTVVDVLLGDRIPMYKGTATKALGIEAKFTSDISVHTKFSTHRNQIIRNIEVGSARCPEFVFLLITPRMYRVQRSRFYVYKMDEYLGDNGAEALNRDSSTKPGLEVTSRWRERMGWLDWEDIVGLVCPGGQPAFDHPDSGALPAFLAQRLL